MCITLCQNIALIVRISKMYDMWQKRKVQTIVLTLRDSSHLQSTESWDSPYNKIGLKWQDAVLCPQLSSGLHGGEEKGVRGAEREFRELCCSSLACGRRRALRRSSPPLPSCVCRCGPRVANSGCADLASREVLWVCERTPCIVPCGTSLSAWFALSNPVRRIICRSGKVCRLFGGLRAVGLMKSLKTV